MPQGKWLFPYDLLFKRLLNTLFSSYSKLFTTFLKTELREDTVEGEVC